MNKKTWTSFCLCTILLTGCGLGINAEPSVLTPDFVTATLPSTDTPQPETVQLPTFPAPEAATAVIQPVEGVTTTQLNLRSEPSTAGESLGMVAAFSTVQIIGREAYDRWYQIADASSPSGNGWIIASYVQVQGSGEIPTIDLGPSGLVIQGLNVRNGPGRDYASLGTLVANDVISVTAKDSSGDWLQINFKGQPGWVAAEFMQVDHSESLPVIAVQEQETGGVTEPSSTEVPALTLQDNDSLEAPIAVVQLGSAQASGLQSNGFVSLAAGDPADWIQFTSSSTSATVRIKCTPDSLQMDLYADRSLANEGFLKCNEIKTLNTVPGQIYTLKLWSNAETTLPIPYSVFINMVR